MAYRIVVIGGGFAGVWSALSAARHLDELNVRDAVRVTLVSADPWLTIRPRLYERALDEVRVPLDLLLAPVGVERIEAFVVNIDAATRTVTVRAGDHLGVEAYDRLVLAAGSNVQRPPLPGLEHAFSVDTYREALRLAEHLRTPLAGAPAVVIGAGFTGLEVATELAGRLRALGGRHGAFSPGGHVTLVDSASGVGPDIGPGPRPIIEQALRDLDIDVRLGSAVVEIEPSGVTLASGERLRASTTVWTAGLRANPLAKALGPGTDPLGRLPVDEALRVAGMDDVFAAGDVARAMADVGHPTLMSCQHAIPMGKFAGHNAAAELVGGPVLPYRQRDYVTCLDLGPAGALFTRGWDRTVIHTGTAGKRVKAQINRYDIYPPLSGDRRELLRAARPEEVFLDGLVAIGAAA